MLRSRIIASAAAAAILASGCATRPPPPITAEQANALPPQQLAEIVLRQLAGRIRSVTRPNYESLLMPGIPLRTLVFATTPRSSAFQGLCEASVIAVSFTERLPFPPPGRNAPVRAQDITTGILFKVVGEIHLVGGLTVEARERQDLHCAAQVPVIAPEENRLGYRQFFSFHGDLWAGHGAAILQGLLRGVADGTHTDHVCVPRARCQDAGAMLRALSLDDLLSIRVERAPQSPTLHTVSASFLESGTEGTITFVEVTVEAEVDAGTPPRLIRRLGHATVGRTTMIRD
jgi:hypothetical protein